MRPSRNCHKLQLESLFVAEGAKKRKKKEEALFHSGLGGPAENGQV
jgi:hypothetical protein